MASDGKYAFVEMRTEELCTMAMQLDKAASRVCVESNT